MLFFETGGQAAVFLLMVPFGWGMALLLHLSGRAGRWRLLTDVLLLLAGGLAFFLFCMMQREDGLHLYHLLAVLTGGLLYRLGARSLLERLFPKAKKSRDHSRKKVQRVEHNQ